MNVMPKQVAAAHFDLAAWREELLALSPWARGLAIDAKCAEFIAARHKATLARHAEGKEAWNAWANGMLALKSALESVGQWAAKREDVWALLAGENEVTREWLTLASATFGTETTPHRFETDFSFTEFIFPSEAWFERAIFTGAQFAGVTFNGAASFRDAIFRGVAWFVGATFTGRAGFERTTFSDDARFDGATFAGRAGFERATFSGDARFENAAFSGRTRFVGAAFSGRALLKRARFNATAKFSQAKFEEPASFESSVFQESANFEGIDSAAAFSLADATFRQVPSFIGATFKGALRLDNVATPRSPWWMFGYMPEKDSSARFRDLRRRAVDAQDRDRELEFFAQEIRTRRFHSKGLPSWVLEVRLPLWVPKVWSLSFWLGLGFGTFSNFGRSLWRPLLTWLALLLGFVVFFLGEHEDMRKARAAIEAAGESGTLGAYAVTTARAWNNPPECSVKGREPFTSTDALTEAKLLSLKNALVFNVGGSESVRRTYGCLFGLDEGGQVRVSARVSTASTLQALASGLLIFLFLLAVRNLLRLR